MLDNLCKSFYYLSFHYRGYRMTNKELFYLLTKWQNPHYKYKMHSKKPFILYIKNKNLPRKVFYVKYTNDNVVLSTRETDLSKAERFAIEHLDNHDAESIKTRKKTDEFHKLLQEYYAEGSEHIAYCNKHNRSVTETGRKHYHAVMLKICELTPDVKKFKEITKQRLIKLQSALIETGLSVSTVKNYFFAFGRIYKELLDKDIIEDNPFEKVPPLKTEIGQTWDGFPPKLFNNRLPLLPTQLEKETDLIYALVSFIAIMTGMRKGEMDLLTVDSIKEGERDEKGHKTFWLQVDGTKTNNAVRTIPITHMTALAIQCYG